MRDQNNKVVFQKHFGHSFVEIFPKGGFRFFHKKGGLGKIGGYFKKEGTLSLIFILTSPFQS